VNLGGLQIPSTKLDFFIRSVEIASYIPGRVRLYSRHMIGNPQLEAQVRQQLESFVELDAVETNIRSGSILIHYQPERLHRNAELSKVEAYIKTHVRRRK